MRSLFVVAVLAVTLCLAGCGLQNVNSSNSLDLHIRNDTRGVVTLEIPGVPGSATTLAKHQGIFESAWHNSQPGVAVIRVVQGRGGGKVLGCLNVRYRKGQEHAFVLVTTATPCASVTHDGTSHWIGLAVLVAAVLALLIFLGTRFLQPFSPGTAERFEAAVGFWAPGVRSRVPEEWPVPIAFAVLWFVPLVVAVARPSWWDRVSVPGTVLSLALLVVLVGALLSRSRPAWWILVVVYVGGFVTWVQHVVSHGVGVTWTVLGLLTLVNFALLISAPMRRFVRFRGRLAPK